MNPEYTNQKTEEEYEYVYDELDEDPVIQNQQYMVLSYAFSKNPDRNGNILPMIKVRGSYRTLEECDKRIKVLDEVSKDPPSIALLKTEVGKWIGLYSFEELQKNTDIDVEYKDEFMNKAMKDLRDGERRANERFYERIKRDTEKVVSDASVEGQQRLNSEREHPISVYNRLKTFENNVGVLKEKLAFAQAELQKTQDKLKNEYSEEEIKEAHEKVKEAFNLYQTEQEEKAKTLRRKKKVLEQIQEENEASGSGSGSSSKQ